MTGIANAALVVGFLAAVGAVFVALVLWRPHEDGDDL